MTRLAGKVAIVTGAAQGIGKAFAMGLAKEGAKIVVADWGDGSATAEEIVRANGAAVYVKTDVSDPASVRAMVARTIEEFGRADILVNNAAIFSKIPARHFSEIPSDEFDQVMAVNVRGPFECAKALTEQFRKQGYGKIVNISSGTVFKGSPHLLHYVASKGAVVAMTRVLARELGEFGVTVNAIAPGLTMSDGVLAQPDFTPEYIQANLSARALKRKQQPQDLVGACVFLASPDSDFITGQTIVVDGGNVMH
jgi:NAD(P)-dependent dehydrogenase (short-subunit alcohol dehydrogenase family)